MTPPDDDLDALVTELNTASAAQAAPSIARSGAPTDAHVARLRAWLEFLVERDGSDLLLVAGAPPSMRVGGRVEAFSEAPLCGEEIEEAVLPALPRTRAGTTTTPALPTDRSARATSGVFASTCITSATGRRLRFAAFPRSCRDSRRSIFRRTSKH